jgi:hypothetical protein
MPSIEIHMNLLLIPLIMLGSALIGYAFRSHQIKSARYKVAALENEMLKNHAEILTLQKEIARLQNVTADSKTPVVNIKEDKNANKKHV